MIETISNSSRIMSFDRDASFNRKWFKFWKPKGESGGLDLQLVSCVSGHWITDYCWLYSCYPDYGYINLSPLLPIST